MLRFTDIAGRWQAVRSSTPLPVGGGQVLHWLSDDFNASEINSDLWEVTGAPAVANSELTVTSGQALLSMTSFQPPCLIEAVIMMTARASGDDLRIGFYRDNGNLVEWGATGTTAAHMDMRMRADGLVGDLSGQDVGASTSQYRLASIYVGIGEVVWSFRPVNQLVGHALPRRMVELGIPDGPFRVRIAGLAGTSGLRVHRVQAFQLADTLPPGGLGNAVEAFALPVRVVNGPFTATAGGTTVNISSTSTDTFSSLAAGSVGLGSNRTFATELLHIQLYTHGDQPFAVWLEGQPDGANWQPIWHGSSVDANPEGSSLPARHYAVSPILQWTRGTSALRVRVKNNGASAGTFRAVICATSL